MFKSFFKKEAFASSQFRWFYLGRTVSLFGSAMTPLALAFAVLQVPQGQYLLGYVLAAEILPYVLMLLIGGSIADRYRRDRLLLLGNVGSGLSQAGIAVIVLTGSNPYLIFPLAVINGILGAFISPATRGIIPEIVDSKDIKQANSLLSTASSTAKIVGPTVAGILVASLGGGWGIAIDAASFLIAAVIMLQVRVPSHPVVDHVPIFKNMKDGWSYFKSRRWIWSMTVSFALMNAVQIGVWQVLGPIIAKNTFGSSGWGLALTIKAVGLLIASLAMLKLQFKRPLRDGMIAVAAAGLPMIVLGQGYALSYLLVAAALAGAGQSISGIAWDTSLQQGVPKDKLSRVCAFDDFGAYITLPIGQILAVPVAGMFGYQAVATVGGILFIIFALLPLTGRLVRQLTPEDIRALKVDASESLSEQV